jgi:ethanolamine utilization protein EutN
MLLARVIGNVVSTMKDPGLVAKKILVVQPIDSHGKDRGAKLLALDSVGAGAGETVYYCRGREASFPWYPDEVPTDSTIVGIVDEVHATMKPEPEARRPETQELPRRARGRRKR